MASIDFQELDDGIAQCRSLRDAVFYLHKVTGSDRVTISLYGFFVHSRARARNDYVLAHTAPQAIEDAFVAAGGVAMDNYAQRQEEFREAMQISLVQLRDQFRDMGHPRWEFMQFLIDHGNKSVWFTPIRDPIVSGLGVTNQFYREENEPSLIPPDELGPLANFFHQSVKRHKLVAREFNLTPKEIEVLVYLSEGRSAQDIAAKENVSPRAIELRLQSARQKLRAANSVEAVHKAIAYAILPLA